MTAPDWTWTDDYSRAYAETSDPRVLAVIERDTDAQGPDGDALAPAYWIEHRGEWSCQGQAGSTFDDSEALDTYLTARNAARVRPHRITADSHEFAARFMRAFHDTTVELVTSRTDRSGGTVLLLNTPAFRTHVGIEDATGKRALNGAGEPMEDSVALSLEGELHDFQAWLDGDVFGVGYAVNAGRVLADAEIDLDDYEVTIEVWGHYGEQYAKEFALEFGYGEPALPTMLPLNESEATA